MQKGIFYCILLFRSSSLSFETEFAVNTSAKFMNSLNSSIEKCIDLVWYRIGTCIVKSQTIPSPCLRMIFTMQIYTMRHNTPQNRG